MKGYEMHRVTACKAEDDYKLWIRFDDGQDALVPGSRVSQEENG